MSGFGIQKRGTGRAVKKMSLGGALAIKSKAYQGKPGTYEQSYYTQALFPQVTQAGYVPPPEEGKKEDEKEIENRAGIVIKEMGKMSEAYRQAINLFVIEGKSHKEISVSLGIQEGTSKSNFFRAKAKINKTLRKKYPAIFWMKN